MPLKEDNGKKQKLTIGIFYGQKKSGFKMRLITAI